MSIYVNILPLGVCIMSRVEKFKEYRQEIMNLPDDQVVTKKQKSSERVEKIISKKESSRVLQFDDVLEGLDIYQVPEHLQERHLSIYKRKLIFFYCVMFLVIIALVVGLVLTGLEAFGG